MLSDISDEGLIKTKKHFEKYGEEAQQNNMAHEILFRSFGKEWWEYNINVSESKNYLNTMSIMSLIASK